MARSITYTFAKETQKESFLKKGFTAAVFVFDKPSEIYLDEKKRKTIQIGIGKKQELNRRKLILHIRKTIQTAKQQKARKLFFSWNTLEKFLSAAQNETDFGRLFGENCELANFEFNQFKAKPQGGWNEITNLVFLGNVPKDFELGIRRGALIGSYINECRILGNTPGGDMTPKTLAANAKRLMKGTGVTVRIWGEKEMKKNGMGAVLGVARGSEEEAQFIILEYRGGAKKEKPIVLAGKGVTFDTGGINLKPSNAINDMHLDMCGGAAVIGALALAGKLKLKKNIIGLVPAVENMPSGGSYRPGDILKSLSGKTIEVLNTDAEGRIILADALTYAARHKPVLVVDIATLTGAAVAALGTRASAFFAKDEKLQKLFQDLGEESGDYVWPLPLWEEYEEDVKGTFGDVANISTGPAGSSGGAINGAAFLYQFVKGKDGKEQYPWVHLDIAPRMTATHGEYLSKGATGEPIRFLVRLLEQFD